MKDRQLNVKNFAEMRELALSSPDFESFHQHYMLHRAAGDPGFAHNEHEYEYQNNGDSVPDYPWIEHVFSADLLQTAYNFFWQNPAGNFFQFINALYYRGKNLYGFDNVQQKKSMFRSACYSNLAWASKRKVSDTHKAIFARIKQKLGIHYKTPYMYSKAVKSSQAIKDRKYNVVIFDDGSILYRGDWVICNAAEIPRCDL